MKDKLQRLLTILLLICMQFPVWASEPEEDFKIRGVQAYLPEVIVEVGNVSEVKAQEVEATLGGKQLSVVSAVKGEGEEISSHIYLLFDISGSMKQSLEAMKSSAKGLIENCKEKDRVTIVTFGERVQTLVKESGNKQELIEAVNSLTATDEYTLLYEGLHRVCEQTTAIYSQYNRTYGIVFTDGRDDQKGNITLSEVTQRLEGHAFPIYALCTERATKEGADILGALARTSGGEMVMLDASHTDQSLRELKQIVDSVTLITLHSNSNVSLSTKEVLTLEINGQQKELTINGAKSLEDTIAPTVKEVTYDEENDFIKVVFSEPVLNAGETATYTITREEKEFPVVRVEYQEQTLTAKVYVSEKLIGEAFGLELTGITDSSQEKNPLENGAISFQGTTGVMTKEKGKVEPPLLVLIAFLAVVLLVLVIVVLTMVSKKKKEEREKDAFAVGDIQQLPMDKRVYTYGQEQEIQYHIKKPEGKKICLFVELQKSKIQKVELEIVSSITIGRSDACDVYVDDTKMSRQHLSIEVVNDSFVVTDLNSTNGTRLNRIPLKSRQVLNDGDCLVAGNTKMVVKL